MGTLIQPYKGKFSAILLFGPPGAGKKALGTFLAHSGTQHYLAMADILRSLPVRSPAGQLYYSYASKGELLPDDATVEIWKYYVQGLIATNAYDPETQDLLLDGLPLTLTQAVLLQDIIQVRHIIVLEISNREELYRRMQYRARLEGKLEEIDISVLENRFKVYQQETQKIFDFYPKHLISRIDGSQRKLEVMRDVLVRISHLLAHGPS